jgi:hydrogenase maturation protease
MVDTSVPLVIGIGNTIMGDDGVGPEVISLLEKIPGFKAELLVLDTPGFALLTYIQNRDKVIIIDAADFDAPPGTVAKITSNDVQRKKTASISLHDADPFAVVDYAATMGLAPKELVVYAIRFESIEPRLTLTPVMVEAALKVVDMIVKEL